MNVFSIQYELTIGNLRKQKIQIKLTVEIDENELFLLELEAELGFWWSGSFAVDPEPGLWTKSVTRFNIDQVSREKLIRL
jgi:hypothetical protein